MHIACLQYDIAWEDKTANYAAVESLFRSASLPERSLAVLPEMAFTGFSMNVHRIAEPEGGESQQFLRRMAQAHGIWVLGGVVTAGPTGRGCNQSVLFSPAGEEVARYSKIQPFTLGKEAENYSAGNTIVTAACEGCVLAPFICYDLRFPELFRAAALRRPQLYVIIANWPDARLHHWVRLLQARAIENQAYVVGVNRCGNDPGYRYSGRSLIADPHGEIIADAGSAAGVTQASLDLEWLAAYRRDLPFLEDMRADFVTAVSSARKLES